MASDLVSRLSEALDEAERLATAAKTACRDVGDWATEDGELFATYLGLWSPDRCSEHDPGIPNHCDDARIALVDQDMVTGREQQAAIFAQLAHWDPQTVLRLVAAHRKLIRLHSRGHACNPWNHQAPCETLLVLAEAWGITAEEGR